MNLVMARRKEPQLEQELVQEPGRRWLTDAGPNAIPSPTVPGALRIPARRSPEPCAYSARRFPEPYVYPAQRFPEPYAYQPGGFRSLSDSRGVICEKVTTFCFSRTHDPLFEANQASMGRNSENNGTRVREISKTPVFGKITASLSARAVSERVGATFSGRTRLVKNPDGQREDADRQKIRVGSGRKRGQADGWREEASGEHSGRRLAAGGCVWAKFPLSGCPAGTQWVIVYIYCRVS